MGDTDQQRSNIPNLWVLVVCIILFENHVNIANLDGDAMPATNVSALSIMKYWSKFGAGILKIHLASLHLIFNDKTAVCFRFRHFN